MFFPPNLGENVDSKLESSRQQTPKNQSEDYEIIVPYLLNGEQWKPINGIYSKVRFHFVDDYIMTYTKIERL